MGADQNWDATVTPNPHSIKVHRSMCSSLIKVVERILRIRPQIEQSRPGSSYGIQSLCSLNTGLDKANSLFNHCADCSKLYLALTGDVLLQRFKRTRSSLIQSLNQIQNMVPVILAAEISVIVSDLKNVKIALNLCEEEAGKAMKEFLQKGIESDPKAAIDVMRFAASRLSITSEKELMIERLSIRKLMDKVGAGEQTKRNILVHLLNMLKDHGQAIVTDLEDNYVPNDDDDDNESFSFTSVEVEPQPEYGDTSSTFTSLASLRSCFNNLVLDPSDLSNVSLNDSCSDNFLRETVEDESKNKFLVEKLDSFPWELQCSMVEEFQNRQPSSSTEIVVDPLLKFVKDAMGLQDLRALKSGCRVLSTCFRTFRSCSSSFQEYELLASLLGYGEAATEEALSIIEALSCHEDCKYTMAASTVFSSVLKLLVDSDSKQIQKSAIIVLKNLSSNKDTHTFIDSSNLIPKLMHFFQDRDLAAHVITVFDNFCLTEEFMAAVSETDGFIGQIAELLEFESSEVQEHAVSVLHSLWQGGYPLAKNEEIIPSLFSLSVNSNEKVKEKALVVLRGFQKPEIQVVQEQRQGSEMDIERSCGKQFSEKKSSCRRTVLGMKISFSSKRPSYIARK